jgi:hypothetical protein
MATEIPFLGDAWAWQADAGTWRYVVDKINAPPGAIRVKYFAFDGGVSLYENHGGAGRFMHGATAAD